jgi:hypothetical protein
MKLIDFFSRAKRRGSYPEEIDAQARLANDRTDRSSMADLVRLLQKHDRSRQESDDRAIL